jgi:hypothetical protein
VLMVGLGRVMFTLVSIISCLEYLMTTCACLVFSMSRVLTIFAGINS